MSVAYITTKLNKLTFQIDFGIGKHLWRTNKIDFISWLGCIIVCVAVGIEVGLLFGVALSIVHVLLKAARPQTLVYVEKVRKCEV